MNRGDTLATVPSSDESAGWMVTPSRYRYRNPLAPGGASPVRAFVIRDGARKELDITVETTTTAPGTEGGFGMRLTMGTTRVCARFTGADVVRDQPGMFVAKADDASIVECTDIAVHPGPRCGDGSCDPGESCGRCFSDCGPCPEPPSPPLLPLTVDVSTFDAFLASADCSALPSGVAIPDPTTGSCGIGFDPVLSAEALVDALPTACCGDGVCGGGKQPAYPYDQQPYRALPLGAEVPTVLSVVAGCLAADPPITDFVVPVASSSACENYGQFLGSIALVPVHITNVVTGAGGRIEAVPSCGLGMCGFGFCAPGATCETCSRECGPQ